MEPTVRKPLLLPRRKTVYLLVKAGAPVPSIHCAKKAVQLELGLRLGDGLDVRGCGRACRCTARAAPRRNLLEGVVAHLPAEHVEDHGALFEGHGLELRGEGVEAAEGGEGLGVVGEGAGGDVGDGGLEGGLAGGVFEVHQLGVAGHAVGDPGVVQGGGRDLGAPPLVGEGVGESRRCSLRAAMRPPAMAAISGAQAAETASSGSSTRLMWLDSGWPKVLVMNSNSRSAVAGEVVRRLLCASR